MKNKKIRKLSRTLLTLILIIGIQTAYSQTHSQIFGNVTLAEVQMEEYSEDASAEAVVLYDIGESVFDLTSGGWQIIFSKRTKIKIFSDAGLKQGTISIPYYIEGLNEESVLDIEAWTYNEENGHIVKTRLKPENIFEEKKNSRWKVKKFAFPALKAGSVIEYRYKLESTYLFNLQDWAFQRRIPTVYSKYTVKQLPFFTYKFILKGADNFDEHKSYKDTGLPRSFGASGTHTEHKYHDMVHEYIMKDVPAFTDENFITSMSDYIIKMDFQLAKVNYLDGTVTEIMTTWTKMSKDLLRSTDFGKFVKSSKRATKKIISENNMVEKSETEKLEFAMAYTKKNYTWSKQNWYQATKKYKHFIKEKSGNSAEVNLFLTGMLQAAGMDAKPVLISTRNHGKVSQTYPFLHFFNSVIVLVYVNGKSYLVDATDTYCPNNKIPIRCINEKGFIIDKKQNAWVHLTQSSPSSITRSFAISFSDKGDSTFTDFREKYSDYDAVKMRKRYGNNTELLEDFAENTGFELTSEVTEDNVDEIPKPYLLKYKASRLTSRVEGMLIVSPFCNKLISKNPIKNTERTYPIDMIYPKSRVFNSQIAIPEGWELQKVPESIDISNELVKIKYEAKSINSSTVQVIAVYTFKKAVYPASDCLKLKLHFDEIIKQFNQDIVLVKEK